MRKKKYENFIAKLMMTKDIIDAAELEKHIRNVVGYDKSSLEKEYFRINELIENQYEKYGIINEGDNIEAFRRGYYALNKLSVTLDDIRNKINSLGYEKESGIGIRIQQDWNYAAHLLIDLLYLENINLHNYSCLLKDCLKLTGNSPMYSKALLRVAVEELTKQFSASLVNLFFADKDGGDLKIASHHRATAYDDYRREIARILS